MALGSGVLTAVCGIVQALVVPYWRVGHDLIGVIELTAVDDYEFDILGDELDCATGLER